MAKDRGKKKKTHSGRSGHYQQSATYDHHDHEPTTTSTLALTHSDEHHDPAPSAKSSNCSTSPTTAPDTTIAEPSTTIDASASAPSAPPARKPAGPRQFLLVIDVEGTCDEHARFDYFNEIIELPCVLADGVTGDVIDEFQTYVRPIEQPTLSDYCTRLTGITQAQVDAAPTFPAALWRLEAWLQTHGVLAVFSFTRGDEDALVDAVAAPSLGEKKVKTAAGPPDGVNVTVVTDGPWDVRDFLRKSLTIHHLPRPWYLRRFLDTRKFIHRTLHPTTSLSLAGQLHLFGLTFTGREHSGLDDSRNIARIVAHLIQVEKCVLRANWRLTGTLTHGARVARAVPHGGRCWRSGDEVWEWVDVSRDGKVVRQRPPRPVGELKVATVGGDAGATSGEKAAVAVWTGVGENGPVGDGGAGDCAGPDGGEDGTAGGDGAATEDGLTGNEGTPDAADSDAAVLSAEAADAEEASYEAEWKVVKARPSRRAD
ncbi:hypothetical protein AMAG_10714 [Allomyces macrogynus ATCC 38327]|uniref:Exonuclease domain-containing protein n=1 Tax=Allomyces macrogynus (strain ATCC 38327) TaxID=578462 RepID=A0A0L0SR98_ALLM3|nr:hypothetical protein AMAG_10714 [Allomyces macrogynus ATCC 38327]|eukprot:KNE65048.1 hypothetical protein AMAG_10714 [Allomyces macrogynus ATCC 38327]